MSKAPMNLRLILTFIALCLSLTQSYAGEPLRAGIDVPEPIIIKKIEVKYPFPAPEGAVVILSVVINEQGVVTDVEAGQYDSAFLEAAKSSVWKWRFSPTLVDGKAVTVSATITILFSLGRALHTFDLGTNFVEILPLGNSVTLCTFSVVMDPAGNLKEEPDGLVTTWEVPNGPREEVSSKKFCGARQYFSLFPEADTPFPLIEEKMKAQTSFAPHFLRSPRYHFPDSLRIKYVRPGLNRLYYSVLLVSNGSQLIQLAGVDQDVQPPKLDVEFNHLAESLRNSSYKRGAIYFFTVFVDAKGSVLGVESSDAKNEAVLEALSKVTVISPGIREGKPVPIAVILAIPLK
jgi:TonB family protein